MADPVSINVADAAEGAALVRSLARHGLIAALVRAGDWWQVRVTSPGDDPRVFLADIGVALAAWRRREPEGHAAPRERRPAA